MIIGLDEVIRKPDKFFFQENVFKSLKSVIQLTRMIQNSYIFIFMEILKKT
jgi:hypothetical protein